MFRENFAKLKENFAKHEIDNFTMFRGGCEWCGLTGEKPRRAVVAKSDINEEFRKNFAKLKENFARHEIALTSFFKIHCQSPLKCNFSENPK